MQNSKTTIVTMKCGMRVNMAADECRLLHAFILALGESMPRLLHGMETAQQAGNADVSAIYSAAVMYHKGKLEMGAA